MYQLCLGDESLPSVIDRITERACAAAPGMDPDACRRLVELVFRARVRQTEACGEHAACQPGASVFHTGEAPVGETCEWQDLDPQSLPAMFGAAAADLVPDAPDRAVVTRRLAAAFLGVLSELLFKNPRCGHDPVCHAEPLFPLSPRRGG